MTPFLLHLLRHGAPDVPGLMLGHTDAAPSAAGIAACVARAVGLEFDAAIASDLRRTCDAARAIADARAMLLAIDPRWRELDFGTWDGLVPAEIDAAALGRFWADPDTDPPPGGERWSSLRARVAAALRDLASLPTLIVTHGGAIRAALAELCGFDHAQLWAFELPYASLLTLRVWPGETPSAQIVGLRA
ncbi:MAG: histidine phosphatase family protein [Sphingomonas sp.]